MSDDFTITLCVVCVMSFRGRLQFLVVINLAIHLSRRNKNSLPGEYYAGLRDTYVNA